MVGGIQLSLSVPKYATSKTATPVDTFALWRYNLVPVPQVGQREDHTLNGSLEDMLDQVSNRLSPRSRLAFEIRRIWDW
jgi:hypothetical protein